VKLLAGGNPQIAKAEGDAPVQAYIAAMPGWKRDSEAPRRAHRAHCPGVRKAVKWNSPFYGVEGQGWFLSFHTFTKYVKVAFFRGASLHPLPPGESKSDDIRYLDIHEADNLDEAQMASWIRQAGLHPRLVAGDRRAKSDPASRQPADPTDSRRGTGSSERASIAGSALELQADRHGAPREADKTRSGHATRKTSGHSVRPRQEAMLPLRERRAHSGRGNAHQKPGSRGLRGAS
jgi:hypothetical protein